MTATAERLCVVGTGAHARKVAWTARAAGWTLAGFADEAPGAVSPIADVPMVIWPDLGLPGHEAEAVFVAIGAALPRQRLMRQLAELGWRLPALVHPKAYVAPDAWLGEGVLVAAGAVVETGCRVERGAIIDVGVMLDHDSSVGAFAHVRASGAIGPRGVIVSPFSKPDNAPAL